MILCQFHFLPLPIIHNKIRYSTNSGSFFVNSSQHQNKKKQKKYPFFSTTHGDLCVLAGFLATRDFQPSPGAEDTATSCTSSECLGRCRGRVLDGTMRWRSYSVNGECLKMPFNLFFLFLSLFLLIYSIYNWSPNKTCDSAAWQALPNVCGDAPAKVHGATVKRWFRQGVMITK